MQPTMNQEFLDCYNQPTEDQKKSLAKQLLENHAADRAESGDFLKQRTLSLLFNHSMSLYYLKAQFHGKPLDEDQHELETLISMVTWMPLSVSSSNKVIKWKKSTKLEETKALIGEHSDKKKVEHKVVHRGTTVQDRTYFGSHYQL